MRPSTADSRFERRVALITAVVLVGVAVFLVIRNRPFADPNLVLIFRSLLALVAAILGATVPGFLNVRYNLGGFSVRAAGALALFVLSYFGTPRVLPMGSLPPPAALTEFDHPKVVDLRTSLGPDAPEDRRGQAKVYLTVPVAVRSTSEPARRVTIDQSDAALASGTGQVHFQWRYFVKMHEERRGLWLGIEEDAHALTIEPGHVEYREVTYEPLGDVSWNSVLELFEPSRADPLTFTIRVKAGEQWLQQQCVPDVNRWRREVAEYESSTGARPGRITMQCR